MKLYVIEGLIGAGKSYLLAHLKKSFKHNQQYVFIDEPAQLFQHFQQHEVFSLLQDNPPQYAFCSQLHICRTIAKYYQVRSERLNNSQIVVTERFHTSPIVFTHALYRQGYLTPFARDLLLDISKEYSSGVNLKVDGVYYLSTDIDTCLKRIQTRGRPGEVEFVTKQYLEHLSYSYDKYLSTITPVKISQTGLEFAQLFEDVKHFIGIK